MKIKIAILSVILIMTTGCAFTPYQKGILYTDATAPAQTALDGHNDIACNKTGTSESTNILGLVGMGDAGVATAMQNGGIKKLASVDVSYNNIYVIFSRTTTVACGE